MRDQLGQFDSAGVRVACVVQGTAEEAARFCGRHSIEKLCIPDPEKQSFRAMGFRRTRWRDLLIPSKDVRERRKEANEAGCGVSVKGTFQKHSDVLQLPGAALVARGGRVLWLHRGTHPADLPSADELLQVVSENLRN